MTADIAAIASDALGALDTGRSIEPFTTRFPDFDSEQAYAVVAAIRSLRVARGEKPIGRKIGFTNRDLWTQYGIDRPVWGDMYTHTVQALDPSEPFPLRLFCEPQIEPEIVLRLSRTPEPGMDEPAILDCVEWVAHGFEIVQSIFPGWRFKVADTIAGFGMHGALRIGAPLAITSQKPQRGARRTPKFYRNLDTRTRCDRNGQRNQCPRWPALGAPPSGRHPRQ
jgi:2-oxo-3-hexenedioate decarboxylase